MYYDRYSDFDSNVKQSYQETEYSNNYPSKKGPNINVTIA